jgi:hypothetical protein
MVLQSWNTPWLIWVLETNSCLCRSLELSSDDCQEQKMNCGFLCFGQNWLETSRARWNQGKTQAKTRFCRTRTRNQETIDDWRGSWHGWKFRDRILHGSNRSILVTAMMHNPWQGRDNDVGAIGNVDEFDVSTKILTFI